MRPEAPFRGFGVVGFKYFRNMNFSVLSSVYHQESAAHLDMALGSIFTQTLLPNEVVLIKDGPLNDALESVIMKYSDLYPSIMKVISLEENKGLGNALRIGADACKYDVIARMDTDDIARPERFERQVEFLKEHPDIDVVGANMEEFDETPNDLNRCRVNPETHNEIIGRIRLRNPFNHPTVMMRKTALLEAGNYNSDLLLFEDYALFLRMWLAGAKFYNMQEILLDFRVGSGVETIKRRSGMHYIEKEERFLQYAKKIGAFNKVDVLKYKVLKYPVRIMPRRVVMFVYNRILREKQ